MTEVTGWKIKVVTDRMPDHIKSFWLQQMGRTGLIKLGTHENMGKIYKNQKTAEKIVTDLNNGEHCKATLIKVMPKIEMRLVK